MYVSPIEKIYGELQTQMAQEDENMVMKAIREVGINVDKEELIKTLQYDRKQYTKGYSDGQSDVLDKIRAEIEPTRKMYLEMNDIDWLNGCDYVLSIIDKYKVKEE